MNTELADLSEKDFSVVKEIYDYYILNTVFTFHVSEITIEALKENIPVNHPKYKSFLIKADGDVCGYCYLSQYKNRKAYDRTAEITLYLKPDFTGKRIGKFVIEKLGEVAAKNDIKVLIAIISGENNQSIKLFEHCGFQKCGHLKHVGEKFDKIIDVVLYQKILKTE